ncbi:hypothetical protein KC321_g31 [Hortaea werneckii]|nr:hypothetical protein KC321_g31 [Hortaea werneckii]
MSISAPSLVVKQDLIRPTGIYICQAAESRYGDSMFNSRVFYHQAQLEEEHTHPYANSFVGSSNSRILSRIPV